MNRLFCSLSVPVLLVAFGEPTLLGSQSLPKITIPVLSCWNRKTVKMEVFERQSDNEI